MKKTQQAHSADRTEVQERRILGQIRGRNRTRGKRRRRGKLDERAARRRRRTRRGASTDRSPGRGTVGPILSHASEGQLTSPSPLTDFEGFESAFAGNRDPPSNEQPEATHDWGPATASDRVVSTGGAEAELTKACPSEAAIAVVSSVDNVTATGSDANIVMATYSTAIIHLRAS